MQNNSKSADDFLSWLEKKQQKDPTYHLIRQDELRPINDTSCEHDDLVIDTSEKDFDCVKCRNPKCGKMWLFPLGSVRGKLKEE